MSSICVWCKREIGYFPETKINADKEEVFADCIVHGVCNACQLKLNMDNSVCLQEFVDSLEAPVAVISAGGIVETGNHKLAALLDQPLNAIQKKLGGVVFKCVNAGLPQGCGRTIHCSGCAVRRTIEDTFKTGQPHYKVPAYLRCADNSESPRDVELLISTEKIQDIVFLRIDMVK